MKWYWVALLIALAVVNFYAAILVLILFKLGELENE